MPFMPGLTVIDKTGLTGVFDIELTYDAADMAFAMETGGNGLAVIGPAIERQLGLKLEKTTAEMPAIVVDHIERPSGN